MITLLRKPDTRLEAFKECAKATKAPIRYDIIDNQTKSIVGTAKTRAGAYRSADKRDCAYGAVRYSVKAVYAS